VDTSTPLATPSGGADAGKSGAGHEALIFFAYLALGVVFLWPLSARPADTVAYVGDSLATVYFVAENGRRLWSDPGSLFSAGVAFPHENAALFEAHRLLPAFLAAPFVALTGNPILVVNLLGWMAYAFNGWAARRLALSLGISPAASFGAGALFAFNTYAVLEQPRLNIILLGFIPLAIVETVTFIRSGGTGQAARAAFLWLLQAYSENYSAIYGGALILFVSALALWGLRDQGVVWSRLRTAAIPALVAGLLFLPVALAYARMDAIYDFRREPPYSMDLSHFFATQPGNWLYGKLGVPVRAQQQGAHFLGFSALALALLTVVSAKGRKRGARVWVLAAAFLAICLVLLAAGRDVRLFGHYLMPGPYGWLFDHVPLFERTRIPERFGLLAMLPIALLAARGVDLVSHNSRALRLGLAMFLSLEHAQKFPWVEAIPTGSATPEVYAWLKSSDARAVVEAPAHGEGLVRMESVDMYFQLFHHKPVLAAYLSFSPLLTRILRQASEDLPHPDALRTLLLAGVDTIVYHQDGNAPPTDWSDAQSSGALVRRAAFNRNPYWLLGPGQDVVFRIAVPLALAAPESRSPSLSTLTRARSVSWRYRAAAGRPERAFDDDPDTQWVFEESILGGEFIQVGFGGETVRFAGIALPLTRRDILPTRFEVEARDAEGRWEKVAEYGAAERDLLVRDLMRSPGRVTLVLNTEERLATGIRLVASPSARSFDGWRLSQIEVLSTRAGLK